jgi:long-chain acyl-CoA synthetase
MTAVSQVESYTIATGGPAPSAPGTLNHLFFDGARKYDKPDALRYKAGGAWHAISHRTLVERVRRIALGLGALGVQKGDRIAILSENRPEWAIVDYACLTGGYTDVPIYPTLVPDQIAYILRDAGTVAVFCSTEQQVEKITSIRAQVPSIRHVYWFGDAALPEAATPLADLEALGAREDSAEVRERYEREALAVAPDHLATIIYTSGTTGEPKGAMLTHDNIYSNVKAVNRVIPSTPADTSLSFLPLSHILERMAGHYLMFEMGVTIAYAESIDALLANFGEIHPTLVVSVPRIYEKIYARVLENALAGSAIKRNIFFWAKRVGEQWADVRLAGREPAGALAFKYRLATKLVFSKLQQRVGGRLRYFVSGGAPLAPEINKFFYAAGLTILEGYGLTETSPVIAVNTPQAFRIGTVGKPAAGVEVRIAPDGEILTRGPHVMKGYFNKPEATAETIDAEGWLHTGDIGQLEDGFLRITDRKKDIIVTAGGKNIAPQPIENQVKTNKYVSQAVMIGDKRKYPVMLVVPNFEQLEKWAKYKNLLWTSRSELLAHPLTRAKMDKEVIGKLTGFANYEMPKKIALLEEDFSIESGELTPTLKVKRRVVDRKYQELIDALYVGRETGIID